MKTTPNIFSLISYFVFTCLMQPLVFCETNAESSQSSTPQIQTAAQQDEKVAELQNLILANVSEAVKETIPQVRSYVQDNLERSLKTIPGASAPDANVQMQGREVLVRFVVPGYPKENLDLSLSGQVLTLRGKGTRSEAGFQSQDFERKVNLPEPVESKPISTKLENGILTVRFTRVAKTEPVKIALS